VGTAGNYNKLAKEIVERMRIMEERAERRMVLRRLF
jgi:hypothetical protein